MLNNSKIAQSQAGRLRMAISEVEAHKYESTAKRREWRMVSCILLASILSVANASAQNPAKEISPDAPALPPPFASLFQGPARSPAPSILQTNNLMFPAVNLSAKRNASGPEPFEVRPGVCRITLQEAQAQAAATDNPMARLGQLQVEVARQHRLGAESDYFPKISATGTNFHFNKFMGALLTINRPIAGGTLTAGLPLAGKDQTLVSVTAAQPITPLFKVHQAVNLARADERVARAKAGLPVESASAIQENYYQLLVAQRRLAQAKANAKRFDRLRLVSENSSAPMSGASSQQLADAADALATASTTEKALMASLDEQMGWPLDTQLELVPPDPEFEDISLREATDKAMAANPEIVEAEQNVVKARAATALGKLDYIPDVAVLGGYVYQSNAVPLLPRDFAFIGVMGTYNVFDFGKREHTIKERKAQLGMAEVAVQLTKAKVAASVKNSYFELQRARELSELRHQLASSLQLRTASLENDQDAVASRAKVEADMFESDLEYRQSLAKLKELIGRH